MIRARSWTTAFAALALLIVCATTPAIARAEETFSPEDVKFFEESVRPTLIKNCVSCHGPEKQEGNLRLDSRESALEGGDSGAAVVPGDLEESMLVSAIHYDAYEMPPTGQLPPETIAVLERWVERGAPWGRSGPLRRQDKISAEDRAHWAFVPLTDPAVPAVENDDWSLNPIDKFLLAKMRSEGLHPSADASREEALRRLSYALRGLPPTDAERTAFLADKAPDVWSRWVELYLADPAYGEKQAVAWLDLVRYAESDGWRQDAYRPNAWRYRDYVIDSFNADRSWFDFAKQNLAGDELYPGDPQALVATGYLRHGMYEYNQADIETQWEEILTDLTDTTGDVFLGMSMGCCRCHDHKFDPIPRDDYYRLRAFFAAVRWVDDAPAATPEQIEAYQVALRTWEEATATIRTQLAAIEQPLWDDAAANRVKFLPDEIKAIFAKSPEDRTPYERQLVELADRQLQQNRDGVNFEKSLKDERLADWKRLHEELAKYDPLKPEPLPQAPAISEIGQHAPEIFIPGREDEPQEPGFLTVLSGDEDKVEPQTADTLLGPTTGRRSALAKWVANPANALTMRVVVNRIWQRHFGVGLVPTASDFGKLADPPSHPELLDWLVARFVESGGCVKSLDRLILQSHAWRQTAFAEPQHPGLLVDAGNRLLWRMNARRLSGEEVRDTLLAATGELDRRGGGPGDAGETNRRAIYLRVMRNSPVEVLALFDLGDRITSLSERQVTTTPLQSLYLLNAEWTLGRAQKLADRTRRESASDEERLERTFQAAWGRPATAEELDRARQFLARRKDQPSFSPGIELATGEDQVRTLVIEPRSGMKPPTAPATDSLPAGKWFVEADVYLDSLYADASVRTIASQWNDDKNSPGWSLGVTSEKSSYQPRNVILQFVGQNAEGKMTYEVVSSNLRLELKRWHRVRVEVDLADPSPAGVRFTVQKLGDDEPGETHQAEVPHSVVSWSGGSMPLAIGGRNQTTAHLWDGQYRRLLMGRRWNETDAEPTPAEWDFTASDDPWRAREVERRFVPPSVDGSETAWRDLAHVLLGANPVFFVD